MSRLGVVSLASLVVVVAVALHDSSTTSADPVAPAARATNESHRSASLAQAPHSEDSAPSLSRTSGTAAPTPQSRLADPAMLVSFAAGAALAAAGIWLPAFLARRRAATRTNRANLPQIAAAPVGFDPDLPVLDDEVELVTLHDAKGLIRYASSSVLALTGLSTPEVVGRAGREIVHPHDWPMVLASIHAARSRADLEPTMFRLRTRGADYLWVEGEFRHSISRTGEPEMTCVARNLARGAIAGQLPGARKMRPALASKVLDATQGFSLQDLCHAFERNEFSLHYQLKVRLSTWEVTGVEALLRWNVPEGAGRTAELIAAAEQSGFIVTLGEWVVRAAARQSLEWRNAGLRYPISVNISARQLHDDRLAALMRELVAADRQLPEFLALEITEGALARNADQAVQSLAQLVAMGFTLHIDDFGTGYSRLSQLSRMPVRALKIDRTFVRGLSAAPQSSETVKAVIALSRALQIGVIAEGVETAEQLELLKSLGCDEAQGYLFAHPMSADAVTALSREPPRS